MDVFEGWEGYLPKLEANWRTLISPQDTVILAGDTSWAMKLEDTKTDFAFIQNLPGQKWLLKGNHDYWWSSVSRLNGLYNKKNIFFTIPTIIGVLIYYFWFPKPIDASVSSWIVCAIIYSSCFLILYFITNIGVLA